MRRRTVLNVGTRRLAALAEQHDEWVEQRRYLGLDVLAKSRLRLLDHGDTATNDEEVTLPAITA